MKVPEPRELSALSAEDIAKATAGWSESRRAALLRWIASQHARIAGVRSAQHPGDLAAQLIPGYVLTPALELIGREVETTLHTPGRNLLVTTPPQEGKSTLCAVATPLRALQIDPETRIILITYADALAEEHSSAAKDLLRRYGTGAIDSLTGAALSDKLGIGLRSDRSATSRWRLAGAKGGMVAVGLGSSITGRPADLLIIDDPYKNRQEADSLAHRRKVDDFFKSVALTRLSPRASVILIQCMTGDTPVLMADGTQQQLRNVRPGNAIATYENGRLGVSHVRNWANQGLDNIFAITLRSGRTVRANARHPFLVKGEGGQEIWRRTSEITPGDRLVGLSAERGSPTLPALLMDAQHPQSAKDYATSTTGASGGLTGIGHPHSIPSLGATDICGTATELGSPSTTPSLRSRVASALSAVSFPMRKIRERTGARSSASTTATTPVGYADCSATTAISRWAMGRQPKSSTPLLDIYEAVTDEVVSVQHWGVAEVFDIEVERTENFIANGLVSHNTRWHPEDLAGATLLTEASLPEEQRTWTHINIPAVAEDGVPDALGRKAGECLESARGRTREDWDVIRRRVGERTWFAMYQGMPTPPEGGLFVRQWFDTHRIASAPTHPVVTVVGVDPAETGEGDEAGIICGSLYSDGRIVLHHDWSGKYTSDEWARVAVDLALETGAREIAVESYTAGTTYSRVVKDAYTALRAEVTQQLSLGPVSPGQRKVLGEMPFHIRAWRGRGDAVARSAMLRADIETGRAVVVGASCALLEDQAVVWQQGQHQPDRVAGAVIVHQRLREMSGGVVHLASPLRNERGGPVPVEMGPGQRHLTVVGSGAWYARTIG